MSENSSENWNLITLALVLVFVVVLWFSYPYWSYLYKDLFYNSEFAEMGVFGDSYGALNTLFSALAFTGIIASIYFQREELKATREELEATRYEMKNQSEQFEAQTEALKLQVFENTFFNMLKLHNDIVESMAVISGGGVISGRRGFKGLCDNLNTHVCDYVYDLKSCVAIYEDFYIFNEHILGHYFRVVYQIFSLVDNSTLHNDEKKKYADILRAQLSTYELILLVIHALSKCGNGNIKSIIEKYFLLEFIPKSQFMRILGGVNVAKEILSCYELSAFGLAPRKEIQDLLVPS
ncbi:hypothetical protein OR620_03820 [Aeromonas hydrophila]|uniref:putative phage abortive infection protein n=1 Tax=Aeromonas hydrophila TaxID=644 RepID=UPI00225187D6|nr:putative phage abortive infection protein [Aeromonas hydrophila]MCX4102912.1 hypothetical protein [Aeromonas hydrophila]